MMLFSKIAYHLNRLSRALKLTILQSKTKTYFFEKTNFVEKYVRLK